MAGNQIKLQLQVVRAKVLSLIKQNEQQAHEILHLQNQIENAKNIILSQKKEIETLQTQNKIVKLAETLSLNPEEIRALKKELKTYIRQIDDSIRLLSE
ncbi:MAG: hypothetical protein MUC81_06280 [Bacteroidia bacterium]|jgi:hypothetical protein|nr:hypothetical protein [Bacteroidia bacterium]